jgi:hypothetical protein
MIGELPAMVARSRIVHHAKRAMQSPERRTAMKNDVSKLIPNQQEGAIGYIFLWLVGVPIPLLFIFFLLRGCT